MESRFTLTWYDVTKEDDNAYDFITWTGNRKTLLISMLEALWLPYEIAGETIGEQKMYMAMSFNEHQAYYDELLTKYEEEYPELKDYATLTSMSKDIHVELPNKKIDADDIYEYPNDGNKVENESKDPTNVLSMRKQYLSQVRNIYREFAMKFADCFIHMF